jgi:hypothetical protein
LHHLLAPIHTVPVVLPWFIRFSFALEIVRPRQSNGRAHARRMARETKRLDDVASCGRVLFEAPNDPRRQWDICPMRDARPCDASPRLEATRPGSA